MHGIEGLLTNRDGILWVKNYNKNMNKRLTIQVLMIHYQLMVNNMSYNRNNEFRQCRRMDDLPDTSLDFKVTMITFALLSILLIRLN